MDLKRIARHLFSSPRAFPKKIAAEVALDSRALFAGQSAREHAIEVYSQLRVWDAEEDNGVPTYALIVDRDIEIAAHQGITARVTPTRWESICRGVEWACARGTYALAIVDGIKEISLLLTQHYPPRLGGRKELPDKPVVL